MRVLIADDSVLLREGLALILADGGHEVVGGVGDGETLVSEALRLRPDVVVADIRMPPSHTDEGLRATTRIRAQWPGAPILLLSQYVVAGYLPDLLADGGGSLGYLLKDRVGDIDAFLGAVERVARGELVLDPDVVSPGPPARPARRPAHRAHAPRAGGPGPHGRGSHQRRHRRDHGGHRGAVEKHTQRIFAKLGLLPDAAVHRRVKAVLTLLSA